jgi:PAS domain S-box-containing protein
MQEVTFDIWWTVAFGTIALLAITVGLVVVVMTGKQKELVTKKRQLEELTISERKYRNLFEQSPAGMLRITTDQWNVVDANHALLRMFAVHTLDEVKEVLTSMFPQDREYLVERFSAGQSVGDYKTLLRRKDGSEFWISFSASIPSLDSFIEAVIIDITTRRLAEDKIREQALLLDQAQDAILVLDLNKTVRYWNKGAERMYGYEPLEVVGREVVKYLYGSDGTDGFDRAYALTVQHSAWSGELHQKKRDGTVVIADCRWTLVHDPGGEPAGILQVCTDVTERKRLETRFLRAQRVESIGIFASGIAHDLSNTLAPVLVGVEVLKRKLLDTQSQRLLKAIESSAKHGSELVYQVLSFVKGVEGKHAKLNPLKIVKDITDLLGDIVPNSVTVRTRISDTVSPVIGDRTQLHQVLINLCTNARDAMPQGGELTFSVENVSVSKEMAEEYVDAVEGEYVVFSISDTGIGIPAVEIHKIFEPFYTTKEIGKGTGLGLSICFGIVKGHKGFMTVESVEGKGTTFKIFLPVSSAVNKGKGEADPQQAYHRSVLYIASSEEKYTHALFEGLKDHGYEPILAAGELQSRETLLQYSGKVQVVVVEGFQRDEIPDMMKDLLSLGPECRIIVLAEKYSKAERPGSETKKPYAVLEQPVTIESLLQTIEQAAMRRNKSA